jgi:hypothetical protein
MRENELPGKNGKAKSKDNNHSHVRIPLASRSWVRVSHIKQGE